MVNIYVVIPVYNAKRFLEKAVYSVLEQPYKKIEVVLVNDGSTDGSADLCDEIARNEPRVVCIHQDNKGVSAARNRGINYCLSFNKQGYIAFLDADDFWLKNIITEDIVKKIFFDLSVDVISFGAISCNETVTKFALPVVYKEEITEDNDIIWRILTHFSASIYNAELLKKFDIKFDENCKYSEDKIFLMRCLFMASKVETTSVILHCHRENPTSAMSKIFNYSPIDYYTQIINGWIKCDFDINKFEHMTGKKSDVGCNLASVYFLDMAKEHYKRWKKSNELLMVKNNPYYYLFENMKENCVSIAQYKEHNFLLEKPNLFKLKYNLIGVVEYLLRMLLRIKPIYLLRQHQKYPLNSIDDIK